MTKAGTDSWSRGRVGVLLLKLFCEGFGTVVITEEIVGRGKSLSGELHIGGQGPGPCPPKPWGKVRRGEDRCFRRDVVHGITLGAWSVSGSQRPSKGGRSIPRTSHPLLSLHLPRAVSSSNMGSAFRRWVNGRKTNRL